MEMNALVALFNHGRYTDMEPLVRAMTRRFPHHGFGWKVLGAMLMQQARIAEALAAMAKAAELLPGDADAHGNLGVAFQGQGRLTDAVASYKRALAIKPDFAEAHSNLGTALRDQGRLAEAEASYRRALEISPTYAKAHANLSVVFADQGRLAEAEASARCALQINPDYAEAHSNLGCVLVDQGRLIEAEASHRRALEINPEFAEAHSNLGNVLKDQGRLGEAEVSYRGALAIRPDYAKGHNNLGALLNEQNRLCEAEAGYRRALELKPDFAEAHGNLGNVLKDQGRLCEAEASYRRALRIRPDDAKTHSNLLFCLGNNEAISVQALFAEHRRFGEQFEAPVRASWRRHDNTRDPDRCLQIGFVSGDLRNHAIAYFLEPALVHLAGYRQLSLHAYSNHPMEDHVTRRLRGYVSHWHPSAGLSDAALDEKIRDDGIDILIDLSSHTAKHRLLTFARKPAPVQASWMAYPGTTGLSAMDYYLTDRFFLPPGQFEEQFTEKIVRLPAGAPFLPAAAAPPVNSLPAQSNGFVTFGSFNRPTKLNTSVIALWAQVLRALPDSRMVLGAMPADNGYDALIDGFAKEGIARERLSLYARCDLETYLSLHGQVDICLDSFPYTGGTTTLHALWMGVPTLTLAGHTIPGRPGACVLGHAGLDEFIAQDVGDFVHKGLKWARDLSSLASLRAGLRRRFAQSPMSQPARVAAGVERALRIMWQRWCAGLPAKSFDVCLDNP